VGLEHRQLGRIGAIGVDEIAYAKGHKYLTLVYQIEQGCVRLLWIGRERTVESFEQFFTMIGETVAGQIEFVCSDMWQPYLKVIRERCSQAIHILDRFHIVAKMNAAVDEVRAGEARRLARDGYEPILKKTRWCVLKRKANLTERQRFRLRDLLRYNLQTVRAYLLKEDFQQFWDYESPTWAGKFLDDWCRQAMRSRIQPMKKVARTLRSHRELILNYFRAKKAPQRHRRGPQQQGESDHAKILRLPHLPRPGNRVISWAWQIARAGRRPQIFLTRQFSFHNCRPRPRPAVTPGAGV
jgi:transposase